MLQTSFPNNFVGPVSNIYSIIHDFEYTIPLFMRTRFPYFGLNRLIRKKEKQLVYKLTEDEEKLNAAELCNQCLALYYTQLNAIIA